MLRRAVVIKWYEVVREVLSVLQVTFKELKLMVRSCGVLSPPKSVLLSTPHTTTKIRTLTALEILINWT